MKKTFVCAAVLGALLTAGPFAYAQQADAKQQDQKQEKKIDPKKLKESIAQQADAKQQDQEQEKKVNPKKLQGSIASKRMNELDRQFSFTPEQKKKIDPIIQDEAQKLTKIEIDKSLDRREKLKQRKTIVGETTTKIKQHLTPDQIKKTDPKNRKDLKQEILK